MDVMAIADELAGRELLGFEAPSDESILAQVRNGRTDLFGVLFARHFRRLLRIATCVLRDRAEAEDVVQEAYVRAYQHLGQFAGRAQFTTWITRIVIYGAYARRRSRTRWKSWPQAPELELCGTSRGPQLWEPESRRANHELSIALTEAIDHLPDRYREVFLLRAVDDQPAREVAAKLAISEAAVKVRFHRARTRLRLELSRYVDWSASSRYRGFEQVGAGSAEKRVAANGRISTSTCC
jgi:RNA polymerase sigma-70 factor (ECF subfamily)